MILGRQTVTQSEMEQAKARWKLREETYGPQSGLTYMAWLVYLAAATARIQNERRLTVIRGGAR